MDDQIALWALVGALVGLPLGQVAYQLVAFYWLDGWSERRRNRKSGKDQ